ncbi:MAG TPA: aconitase/3-isopropylmalate dehydratase large subunit family protein, partial [Thermoplasmataceae archaeon]|nr:aconitase/3-isopropylmalate dehydratase large subunit family protein [Thermoplasmataceae archaeon]
MQGVTEYREIIDDPAMTFSEKILSIKCYHPDSISPRKVAAGDFVIVNVDFTFMHDVQGPLVIKIFKELGGKRIYDPKNVLLNLDHDYPPSSERSAELHKSMRKFAQEQGCQIQEGSNCHQFILERFAEPGMLIVGADSHTTTLGSLGAFATGMGSSDVASILLTGKTWLKVPESIKIVVDGKLKNGVHAKDLALHVLGMLGTDGANYKTIEWTGSTVGLMSVDSRSTLTNLALEMGAKNSVVFPDDITNKYLKERGRSIGIAVTSGAEAQYSREIFIEAEDVESMVALPGSPGNSLIISEMSGQVPIDVVIIGTCTNGRIEDLRTVAKVMKGRKVKSGVRMIITPNSVETYKQAEKEGIISVLVDSGAIVTSPGCGACAGLSKGMIGNNEVAVFAGPRNFPGRLGSVES